MIVSKGKRVNKNAKRRKRPNDKLLLKWSPYDFLPSFMQSVYLHIKYECGDDEWTSKEAEDWIKIMCINRQTKYLRYVLLFIKKERRQKKFRKT